MDGSRVGEWLSLVEHLVRDQGVGGSNPLSPTNIYNEIQAISGMTPRGAGDFVAAKTSEINEKDFDVGVCSYLLVLKRGMVTSCCSGASEE